MYNGFSDKKSYTKQMTLFDIISSAKTPHRVLDLGRDFEHYRKSLRKSAEKARRKGGQRRTESLKKLQERIGKAVFSPCVRVRAS